MPKANQKRETEILLKPKGAQNTFNKGILLDSQYGEYFLYATQNTISDTDQRRSFNIIDVQHAQVLSSTVYNNPKQRKNEPLHYLKSLNLVTVLGRNNYGIPNFQLYRPTAHGMKKVTNISTESLGLELKGHVKYEVLSSQNIFIIFSESILAFVDLLNPKDSTEIQL